MAINTVAFDGNLTYDPELRSTTDGTAVLNFGVAISEVRRLGDEYVEDPVFVDCVVFGGRAESLARILHKGMKVACQGRLRFSAWETQDGQRRTKLSVSVKEVSLPPKPKRDNPRPVQVDDYAEEDYPF